MGSKGWQTYLNEGHIPDDICYDDQSEFIESFNTALLSEGTDMVEEVKQMRNKKLKKSSKETPRR